MKKKRRAVVGFRGFHFGRTIMGHLMRNPRGTRMNRNNKVLVSKC